MKPSIQGSQRRLRRAAAVAIVGALGIAACGSDDDESSSEPASDAESSETEVSEPEGDTVADDTASDDAAGDDTAEGDAGARVAQLLGFDEPSECAGETFRLGSVLALTGPGSFYGTTMTRGTDLAVKHIEAAGGPDFEVKYYDHKSGDPAAGQQAVTELGENGYGAKLASYVDDLGAMLPGTAQYEMFTLDGGGGTSIFGQGQPYFWGTRGITPNDPLPGVLKYVEETNPDAKTIGLVGWDIGEPSNGIIREDIMAKIDASSLEFNGLYELTPVGSQDYSQVLPKISSNEPDVLLASLYGQDIGSFINQAQTAGLESQIIGFEFTPDGINASKGTFDSEGYTFAYDFFDPANPQNDLASLFVEEFNAEYGEDPDFYAANFYEDTLAMWDLTRRVCADGGDINSGPDLDAALRANPTLMSVYGGSGAEIGSKTLDLETHTVVQRPMGVFEYKDGTVTPLAFFDLDAEGFELAQ